MTDIRAIADRVKRQTRNTDILALCDHALTVQTTAARSAPKRDRAAYMRRYRARKKGQI